MSSLKLKHSGGNSVIIAAPDSNPAADRTITLPSNADGTMLTTTSPKAGNIIQVQYGFRTGHLQTTSTSYVDSGITANITPSSTSSKILIQMNVLHGMHYSSNEDVISQIQLMRDSTVIFTERTADYMRGKVDSTWLIAGQYLAHQDSPSTTSAITYKLQIRCGSSNGTVSVWAGSGVILQEVAA